MSILETRLSLAAKIQFLGIRTPILAFAELNGRRYPQLALGSRYFQQARPQHEAIVYRFKHKTKRRKSITARKITITNFIVAFSVGFERGMSGC